MKIKNFLAITVKQKNSIYKTNSVTIGNDLSVYIFNSIQGVAKVTNKGSYHTSGIRHFTTESAKESKKTFFRKVCLSHINIRESQGLETILIKNINTNNFKGVSEFKNQKKYKNIIEIKTNKYHHLGIKIFLAKKGFDTKKSALFYDEVFEFPFDEYVLIIALKNLLNPFTALLFMRGLN